MELHGTTGAKENLVTLFMREALLAVSLGLSRLHADDHAMLEAALPLYDALYAWCNAAQAAARGGNAASVRGTAS